MLLSSSFTLSPRGNTLECFRWYEAAEAGSIPVLSRSDIDASVAKCDLAVFADVPFLLVDEVSQRKPLPYARCRPLPGLTLR